MQSYKVECSTNFHSFSSLCQLCSQILLNLQGREWLLRYFPTNLSRYTLTRLTYDDIICETNQYSGHVPRDVFDRAVETISSLQSLRYHIPRLLWSIITPREIHHITLFVFTIVKIFARSNGCPKVYTWTLYVFRHGTCHAVIGRLIFAN